MVGKELRVLCSAGASALQAGAMRSSPTGPQQAPPHSCQLGCAFFIALAFSLASGSPLHPGSGPVPPVGAPTVPWEPLPCSWAASLPVAWLGYKFCGVMVM